MQNEDPNEPNRKLPDVIGESLGLTQVDEVLAPVDLSTDLQTGEAHRDADKTLDNVIQAGTFALQDLCDKASRATGRDAGSIHRVIAETMNSLANAAKTKMEILALEQKIRMAQVNPNKPDAVNNTLVLTTKDLAEFLLKKESGS